MIHRAPTILLIAYIIRTRAPTGPAGRACRVARGGGGGRVWFERHAPGHRRLRYVQTRIGNTAVNKAVEIG
jgi:hypothetical protein